MGKDYEIHHDATIDATPEQIWDAIATSPGISSWFIGRTDIDGDTVHTTFDNTRTPREPTFITDTEALLARDDRTGALKKFMRHVGVPAVVVHLMPLTPPWRKLKAVAPTLPYDLRILGDTGRGVPLDPTRWTGLTAPAIVMDGGKSPQYMRNAARALSEALPKAGYRTLPGQTHMVKADAVAPALKDFLTA